MKYKTLVGMDYPLKNGVMKRVEAGQIVSDIPTESIGWLVAQKLIEPVGTPDKE
jgi:hypothetical protein